MQGVNRDTNERKELKRKGSDHNVPIAKPVQKRPRGRPRKSVVIPATQGNNGDPGDEDDISVSDFEVHDEPCSSEESSFDQKITSKDSVEKANVPRPRGRPRKQVQDNGSEPSHKTKPLAANPPRARGRPRKTPLEVPRPTVPRPRGRPRKYANSADQVEGESVGESLSTPSIRKSAGLVNAKEAFDHRNLMDVEFPEGYEIAQGELQGHEDMIREISQLRAEVVSLNQRLNEQDNLQDEAIQSLRQEIAELRDLVTNTIPGVSNHQTKRYVVDATPMRGSTVGRQSGKLSRAARKVLEGIAEYEDVEEVPWIGAPLGDVADFAAMQLDEVIKATEELQQFDLISKTDVENEWVLNQDAREILKG